MPEPDDIRQAPGRTLAILGVGTLGFVLAQTTVIPALGEMQSELGASASGIAWMVTAYLLVASIATPIFGKLGDMFGHIPLPAKITVQVLEPIDVSELDTDEAYDLIIDRMQRVLTSLQAERRLPVVG